MELVNIVTTIIIIIKNKPNLYISAIRTLVSALKEMTLKASRSY
jgi:hypothetical protein